MPGDKRERQFCSLGNGDVGPGDLVEQTGCLVHLANLGLHRVEIGLRSADHHGGADGHSFEKVIGNDRRDLHNAMTTMIETGHLEIQPDQHGCIVGTNHGGAGSSVQQVKGLVTRSPRRKLASTGLEPSERLIAGVAVLCAILVAGTTGYVLLGLGVLDALYQTVITISTVGYSDPENVGGRYQVFTIGLILLGTGTTLYTIGVVIEMLFEGRLDDQLRRRRMQRTIDSLTGHAVICGYGQVGRAIAIALADAGHAVVVIDRDEGVGDVDRLMVIGDATEDRTLRDAGITRAKTMVLALDSDVDNLYVALRARSLCPDLFIVARANSAGAVPKLHQAGANRVINPHEIGGSRMAAIAMQSGLSDYFEEVLRRTDQDLRLAEHRIPAGSRFAGRPLSELALERSAGTTLLAIRRGERWHSTPQGGFKLAAGDLLVVLGTVEQLNLALPLVAEESAPSG